MGARLRWASATMFTIWSSNVSLASHSARHDETAKSAALEHWRSFRSNTFIDVRPAKRRLLEIDFPNCRLDGAILFLTMRNEPFDVLAEGLVSEKSRGDTTGIELFLVGVRALALQSRIIDVVRIASRFSSGTGGH
jgi:hypothetical protein